MIYSVVVNLEVENDVEISANLGHHALALFLSLIARSDGHLAQKLHSAEDHKPFTVSTLQGKFSRRKDSIFMHAGAPCWLRITTLEENVFARFMDGMLKSGHRVSLDKAILRISGIVTHPQGSSWAGFTSFETILEQAACERKVSLQFTSPTVFRSGGKRNIAFPSPELVFGSLFSKWNYFSPFKLDSSLLKAVQDHVLLSRYKLETKMLNFNNYQELGFLGSCEYTANDRLPQDSLKALSALADFAFFCGTGAKTTMGMGQTRRMHNGSALPRGTRSHLEKTG